MSKREHDECGPYVRRPWERHRTITVVEGESKTDTSFGNETNINKIIARFSRTGILPADQGGQPQYADVTHLQKDLTEIIEDGRAAEQRVLNANRELEHAKKEKIKAEREQLETRIKELEAKHNQQPPPSNQPEA